MKRRETIFCESEILTNPPAVAAISCLEVKNGEVCLRLGDEIEMVAENKFVITRRWQRPMGKPFNPLFYKSR